MKRKPQSIHVTQEIIGGLLQNQKTGADVVIFQYAAVVVTMGQFVAGLDEEVVVEPRVVMIVNTG